MKISKFSLAAAAVCVTTMISPSLLASPESRLHSRKTLEQNGEERYQYVTGSNLPQKVKVKSIGTDSVHNVRIFTERELQSTGRQNVGEALTLDPSIQLSSRH
ncbi:MAG: hypothetical protein M3Z22_02655 [Verrucomicrobiota bacterium]|nr:hypothetical protein [Verrucomicrobiota bacterium]